jgi:hypothetical protein
VQVRLFTFVQLELPWELGPPDGRYVLRKIDGPDGGEPEHVLVLGTVGAERRGLLGGRTRTRRARGGVTTVPVTRATVIDAVALSAEHQAKAWLSGLDPERETQQAVAALNRLLHAQRMASASAYARDVSPTQALAIRAGFGEGEQVAEGHWTQARDLLLSDHKARRRTGVLRPHERLASLLAGRERPLLCEELVLRARVDLDRQDVELGAIELERAYAAALVELAAEPRFDLDERLRELRELRTGVERAAEVAIGARMDHPGSAGHALEEIDAQQLRHALERLEAALRARVAAATQQRA